MSTPTPANPYAEFGGIPVDTPTTPSPTAQTAVSPSKPSSPSSNPYAEFGGISLEPEAKAIPQQTVPPPKSFWQHAQDTASTVLSDLGLPSTTAEFHQANRMLGSQISHPIETAKQVGKATLQTALSPNDTDALSKARESWNAGNYVESGRHFLNYLVPFVGRSSDLSGDAVDNKEWGKAVGHVIPAVLPLLFGDATAEHPITSEAEAAKATARQYKPQAAVQVSPEAVRAQITKDAIRHTLGSKADSVVVNEAARRIGPTKLFSTVENELKLVKPQVDADLASANTELDHVLSDSPARIQNAGTELHKTFDDMIQDARAGVGDSSEAQKAINSVRDRILPKIGDGDLSVQEVNDLKRKVGDEIKKFQSPDMLNTAGKNEQEAYRQAYFKLRDLVSDAEPATKELNSRISRAITLQELLAKKFPQLETPEAAQASYQGVRSKAIKNTVKKVATLGIAGATAGGLAGHAIHTLGAMHQE